MSELVLFDIDHTLINCGSLPQLRALNTAFQQVYSIRNAFDEVTFTGGLALPLLMEAFRKWSLTGDDGELPPNITAFKQAYLHNLGKFLEDWTAGGTCPGVLPLLKALALNPQVQLGLETGNFREEAYVKLRRYGLDQFFEAGGFGGDHFERPQLVASAIADCQRRSGKTYGPDSVVLVGDSPADIESGKANGIRTVAVATGSFSPQELSQYNPDHILDDLSDTDRVLRLLLGA